MAGVNVGTAYLEIIPSAKGFASKIQGEVAQESVQLGEQMGEKTSSGMKGRMGSLLSKASGLGIGALFAQGLAGAMDAKQLNAKLSASLGLSQTQAKQAGDAAGKLYANGYGENMEGVNDAIKAVIQNIDGMKNANSSTLTDISGKVMTVAQTFDQDLGGTTRAVSQMLRTGLAKNASEALDIITVGFQNGADKSEDFLDTLNEYGTQFRKLGIDGTTATGLIQQGLKAGARDGDLVADSLKEFSIRAIDGSKGTVAAYKELGLNADQMTKKIAAGGPAAKQGLGEVLTKLRGIKDPAQQAAVATSLFGTQAEDMGKALFALDPTKAAKGLGQVAGATDKANKAMNATPQAKLNNFIRSLQGGLVNVLGQKVIPAMEKFKEEFEKGEGAGGQFKDALDKVKSAISGVVNFVQAHPDLTKGLVAGAAGLYTTKKAIDGVSAAYRGVKAGADTAKVGWDAGKTALGGLKSAASSTSSAFGQLRAGLSGAKPPNATAWSAVGNSMRNAGAAAKGYAASAMSASRAALANAASTARQGAAATLTAAKTAIITGATKAWAVAQRLLTAAMNANPIGLVITALVALGAALVVAYNKSETFRNIVTATWNGIKAAAGAVFGWFQNTLWPGLKGVFSNIGNAMVAAKNTIAGAWDKIKGAFQAVWNWVSGVFRNNWKTVATILGGPLVWAFVAIKNNWGKITGAFTAAKNWVMGAFRAAWNGVKAVVQWPLNAAKRAMDTTWTNIKSAFTSVVNWVKGAFKRSWDGIKTVLSKPIEWGKQAIDREITGMRRIFGAIRDFMKGAFKRSWDGLKKIFTAPIELAKSSITGILGKDDKSGLRGVFSNALEAIKKIWEKLKGIVAKPINGVIRIINNPFIKGFNKIGGMVGLKIDAGGKDGGIPEIKGYASGGTIPGPWKGPRADNVLGVSNSGMPVARVNPGEYITKVSSTRSMERKFPGALDYINRTGTLPGFAGGGGIPKSGQSWQWQWEQVRRQFPDARMTSNYRPGARTRGYGNASYHSIGRAIDIGGSPSTLAAVARWIQSNWLGQTHDLLYTPLWGSKGFYKGAWSTQAAATVADHRNHVHWGLEGNAEKGKSLWGQIKGAISDFVFDKLKGPAFRLIDGAVARFGGGDFTKKFLGGLSKKLIEKAISFGNSAGAGGGGGGGGGSTQAASAWIPQIKQALALNGLPASDDLVQKWVRQIQSESSGNPRAVQGAIGDINNRTGNLARGLVQVIPPTFRQYHVPGTSNDIFDPIANLAAGINYAKTRYGLSMPNIGRGHGYAAGGLVELARSLVNAPLFDSGGTLAPGVNIVRNDLGRPEPLVRPEQYTGGGTEIHVHGTKTDSPGDVADAILFAVRRSRRGKYAAI